MERKKTKYIEGEKTVIYGKSDTRREYVLHKKKYIPITEYRKIVANKIKYKKIKTKGGTPENETKFTIEDFINKLYTSKILFPDGETGGKNCFTNGTFIFEDNDNKLFTFLKKFSFTSVWFKTTHKEIKKNDNLICSLKYKENEETCKRNNKKKIYQYEFQLNNGLGQIVQCYTDSMEKRVALVYSFKVKIDQLEKTYVFFKLEDYKAISPQHTLHALSRYVFKTETHQRHEQNILRREDCQKDKKCKIKGNTSYQDEFIINAVGELSSIGEKIKNEIKESNKLYNDNVRTGDEFFVPQYFTTLLLQEGFTV